MQPPRTYVFAVCALHRLADTLQAYVDANEQTECQVDNCKLPDDITLDQTVAMWKYIVTFQAKQKQY